MRFLLLPVVVFTLLLPGAAQTRPQHRPSAEAQRQTRQFQEDQKAIAHLQQQEIEAYIALDLEKLLALYADDVVVLAPDQPPIHGRQELRTRFEQLKKELGNSDVLGYEQNWDEVQVSGDWAYQLGTITARTRPAAGGNETTMNVRAMRILKREPDGAWLIARAVSFPVSEGAPAAPKK